MQKIQYSTLTNGMQIITECAEAVQTVSMHWAVPAGVATNEHDGDSVILTELVQRGVKGFTAQEHHDAIDCLGVRKHLSCGNEFFFVSAVMLAQKQAEALPLVARYLCNPTLPESDLSACQSLCLQSLHSLQDDPAQLASVALNQLHFQSPFNRTGYGEVDAINSATIERLKRVHEKSFVPDGSILTFSGNVNHEAIVEQVQSITEQWNGKSSRCAVDEAPRRGAQWIDHDSSQVHIGIAMDAPNMTSDHSLQESIAMMVFGGSTSGRLFTQVRQKRSLCYGVSARYGAAKQRSVVRIHAGTTPERAQETVDVCLHELQHLKNGITQDEFDRVCLRMKSQIVMRGESTAARSSALWADFYALGKARTLKERLDEIDGVTLTQVNDWIASRLFGALSVVSLGPTELTIDPALLNDC